MYILLQHLNSLTQREKKLYIKIDVRFSTVPIANLCSGSNAPMVNKNWTFATVRHDEDLRFSYLFVCFYIGN